MAPLSLSIMSLLHDFRIYTRDMEWVGNGQAVPEAATLPYRPTWSRDQGYILQILAVTFSAVSVASAGLAFYWFIKMRRSFRHDLIMLLIQSDMFKALWFMLYPIVVFARGEIPNDSTFCQVNGFFIALGVEASDFAVLMIAVHTALYIFNPRNSSSEGGLYPYRRIAYVLWVVFPLLMASLAFINDRHGYVSDGTYCYIPVRPFWYRLALSWIPRYIIFIFILTIYASIYFYVRYKFRNFNKDTRILSYSRNDPTPIGLPTVPPEPPLNRHGLIGTPSISLTDSERRKPSISTIDGLEIDPPTKISPLKFLFKTSCAAKNPSPAVTPEPTGLSGDSDSFDGPSTPRPLPAYMQRKSDSNPTNVQDSLADSSVHTRLTSWQDPSVHRFSPPSTHPVNPNASASAIPTHPSLIHIRDILQHPHHHHHHQPTSYSPPSPSGPRPPPLQLLNSHDPNPNLHHLLATREKIRRQLRFLFIYPLVYIGMWILPFISHILQFSDGLAKHEPFVLVALTTVCMCMQAAVDCWLFSTRERPWRFMGGEGDSFWGSFRFWVRENGCNDMEGDGEGERGGTIGGRGRLGLRTSARTGTWKGPGRTKEEMVRDARAAYRRRDEELAERRDELINGKVGRGGERVERGERSWWEEAEWEGFADEVEYMAERRRGQRKEEEEGGAVKGRADHRGRL